MEDRICDLTGRTAIVTGAAQGIGRAIVNAMAAAGARVIAVDLQADAVTRLDREMPGVTALAGDVTDASLPSALDAMLQSANLRPDILVNNAGIARGADALDTSDAEFQRYLDVNLVALFRLSRWAVGHMARHSGGAIVNIASIFGQVGAQKSCGYSASKAAVIGLTRQMATDFGPSGVRINAVAPGLIHTPLTEERIRTETWRRQIMIEQAPLRRAGSAGDVAKAVRFLASDEAAYITGQTLAIDGGWSVGRYPREVAPDV
ncbi:MAG: SDR family oxidoreductase [Paracoccus sp. (in: a-proteobacteria)]|nr:SDR family oxidoreductase [Paracoccus sp. (in: a-proteobacteria)]